jgi:hypothetical protein
MISRLATCSECGLQVEVLPQGSVLGGPSAQFIAFCKHQNEPNVGCRCRVLQEAIDQVRSNALGCQRGR